MNGTVNSQLFTATLGPASVGLLSALSVGVAALLAVPLSTVSTYKVTAMNGASIAYLTELLLIGVCFAIDVPDRVTGGERGGRWQEMSTGVAWLLYVLLSICHGVGRAVYESVNKALVADVFQERTQAAFSNAILQNGYASTVGFVIFPYMPIGAIIAVCSVAPIVSLPCLLALSRDQSRAGTPTPPPAAEAEAPDEEAKAREEERRSFKL